MAASSKAMLRSSKKLNRSRLPGYYQLFVAGYIYFIYQGF